MSWGERSCKKPCRRPYMCYIDSCNIDCHDYIWDGINEPDSKSGSIKTIEGKIIHWKNKNDNN